jgi:hypothetical protein
MANENPLEGKGPLQSKQIQLAILSVAAVAVGKFHPALGEWIKANSDSLLALYAALSVGLRPVSTKPINWKDWTLFGIGKKF